MKRIGIVQKAAPHLDLPAAMQALEKWLDRAAEEKIDLLVFGEGWLSGYPLWFDHVPEAALWDHPTTKKVYARFRANSPAIDGPELQKICQLVKDRNLLVLLGMNEKVNQGPGNGTIYNSFVLIGPEGNVLNHHRKLCPTFTEKLVHGPGDARGLQTVETAAGRVGGLICWEHWMPLSRQALHNAGETIHVALWPNVHEKHQIASRHYAFEGRCFVVAAGQLMRANELPSEWPLPEHLASDPQQWLLKGGSCVIGPDGDYLVEPDFTGKEWVTAEIDPEKCVQEQMALDVTGHYARNDLFDFKVNR